MTSQQEHDALQRLVKTVNDTGGLVKHADGTLGCVGDPDWLDLADAYVAACEALGLAPVMHEPEDVPSEQDLCAHEWAHTGTEYGGDDESYHGEGRCYCVKCGLDGDA